MSNLFKTLVDMNVPAELLGTQLKNANDIAIVMKNLHSYKEGNMNSPAYDSVMHELLEKWTQVQR